MNDLRADSSSSSRTASAWHIYQQPQRRQRQADGDGDALEAHRHVPEQFRALQQLAELARVA